MNPTLQAQWLEPTAVFPQDLKQVIKVINPISEDFAAMRLSLLPGLFANVIHNCRHGHLQGELFEVGPISFKTDSYQQENRLAFAFWKNDHALWESSVPTVYRLKSAIENLFTLFSPQKKWEWREAETPSALFHPKQVTNLFWQGQIIGTLGTIHPNLKSQYKLRADVAFAEFQLAPIIDKQKHKNFVPLSSFPTVEKDLAFVMPKAMKASEVVKHIQKSAGPLLTSVEVVDVFTGGNLSEGQKSLSFRMVFQSPERTLSDAEVLKLMQEIIDSSQQKLAIQLR